jgi:hypothetical protein
VYNDEMTLKIKPIKNDGEINETISQISLLNADIRNITPASISHSMNPKLAKIMRNLPIAEKVYKAHPSTIFNPI